MPTNASASDRPDTALERDVIEWPEEVYREAEHDLSDSPEIKLTTKVIDYLNSKQWSQKARFSRSKPVANRIFRQFIEMVGLLSDIDPDFVVRMHGKINGYSELEEILNKLIVKWAFGHDFEMKLSQAIMYGLIHTGPAKIQWNPNLNRGLGDVEFLPLSPLNFMMVGAEHDVQEAECCILRQVASVEALVRRYGPIARNVTPDLAYSSSGGELVRPSHVKLSSWNRMSPSLKRLTGKREISTTTRYPNAMLKEFWMKDPTRNESSETITVGKYNWAYKVEPGELIYPRGRVIVTAGGKVLADDPNPYWHGMMPFALYRAIRVPWSIYGLCYSSDTEVLTRRGWLKFSDTNENDEFATRQIDTGEFEWQKAIAHTNEPYCGEMIHFQSTTQDILVTPEHRMLVNQLPRKAGGNCSRKGEAVISARMLAECGTHHTKIPQTSLWGGVEIGQKVFALDRHARGLAMMKKAKRVGRAGMTERQAYIMAQRQSKDVTMSGDDYCAFMGAYLSEGWSSKHGICISQFTGSKGFEPFRELLERIIGKEVLHTGKDFVVSRQALRNHVAQFGGYSHTKFIPEEIMNATPRQLEIFWRYYMLGDGCYQPRKSKSGRGSQSRISQSITTASKRMADQLMEVAQKMGYAATLRTRPARANVKLFGGRVCQVRESYIVSLRYSKAAAVKAKIVNYDGTIHCVTVPNSFLHVRRNGKATWCGNSQMEPLLYMQNVINRINGGIMDQINATIEPTLIAPKNAFSAGDWDSLDPGASGGKIGYQPNTPKPPEYVKRGELASFVMAFKQDMEKEQDQTSGSAAISQALNKKQVPGGDSLEMIKSSRSTNLRLMSKNLESFLNQVGTQVVSNMLQFYTSTHRVRAIGMEGLTGEDFTPVYGTSLPPGVTGEDFVRRYSFEVRNGSLLSIEKNEDLQVAFTMRKMGDISRRAIYRMLQAKGRNINVDQIEKELKDEAAEKIALAGAAGAVAGHGKGKK